MQIVFKTILIALAVLGTQAGDPVGRTANGGDPTAISTTANNGKNPPSNAGGDPSAISTVSKNGGTPPTTGGGDPPASNPPSGQNGNGGGVPPTTGGNNGGGVPPSTGGNGGGNGGNNGNGGGNQGGSIPPTTGTTACPVLTSCLNQGRKSSGRVDPSSGQCYMRQFQNSVSCYNVPNDYKKTYARNFQCVQDQNGHFVCYRGDTHSRMPLCQQPFPGSSSFEVTFLSGNGAGTCMTRQCTMAGGVASCPISPLILDTNKDGVISAQVGIGIDLNMNGVPDGAAVNGDQMLAMSDLNGNKVIDGAEVFGDMTVSPFTKKKLDKQNGFEALRAIAQEASSRDKKSYIKDDNVDMVSLASSLKKQGVTLGFVSGNNTKTVKPLRDVKTISLKYTETKENQQQQQQQQKKDGIVHKQKGSYVDGKGKSHPVDDVWFVESR